MKKQINPTIKAHLIRGAVYLLLLLAVCAIPFVLAERGGTMAKPFVSKQTAAANAAQFPVAARFSGQPGKVSTLSTKRLIVERPTGTSSTLWYNGDFNGVNGLANEENTSIGSGEFASVYDDFIVADSGGWDVTAVFSDNLENTNVTGATWEIRQGISEGNGGTLIASGMTSAPIVTPTGRSGFGFTEFMVEVPGLSVHLPASANPYWLNVTVIGDLSGRSFDSTTSGANCVGMPCGNNQNAFFNSNFFGANFTSTANEGQPTDFSMGVIGIAGGTPSPTPTASPTPTCQVNYTTTTSTGVITPGGTDIGNHCDDCTTDVTLPFPISMYGGPPVTDVALGSDGDVHIPGPYNKLFWWPGCVPVDPMGGQDPFLNTFFPNYADLLTTDGPFQTCSDCGIFTQTVGNPPNRQFIIRWKTVYFNNTGTAEFEVILTEGSDTLTVIYGDTADQGLTAVSGTQQDLNVFTSFSCDEAVLTPGVRVDYIPTGCASPTPTATATATATPTATAAPRETPTPRPRPTPFPRP